MNHRRFFVAVIALLSTVVGFAQSDHPGPDPVQRAILQARNAGRLGDAEKLLRDSIQDLQQRDPRNPRLASYLKQLSNLIARRDGGIAEAAALFQQAYELDLKAFGPDDLRTTLDIVNMAWSAHNAGDDQKAEQLFNHALEAVHSHEGEMRTSNDASVAAAILGAVVPYYRAQKRWVEAEIVLKEEMKLCDLIATPGREGFGDCGGLPESLAEIYREEGRHADSVQVAPDLLFPAELESLHKAGEKFMEDGLYPSAEDAYNRAIALAHRLDADPQSRFNGSLTSRETESLGRLYEKEGANDKAEQAYLAVQAMNERRAGSEPKQMGFAMSLAPINLISLYENEGRYKDAEALLQHVYELQVSYLGEKHRVVVESLTTLASVYEQEGQKNPAQYAQARASYERALSIQESMVGTQHPQLLPLLRLYARLLGMMNETAKMAEVRQRIEAISAAVPP